MSVTVNAIDQQSIKAWFISAETAGDVVEAINTIKPMGWNGQINTTTWTISLSKTGSKDSLTGGNGCWIVFDGMHVDLLTNDQFTSTYTSNTALVWGATSSEPVAAAQSGQSATITVPAPTSYNGPFTYSITATNPATNETIAEELTPASANGQLVFVFNNLVAGADYVFTITCSTQYSGIAATSVPSNQITAAA